MATARFGIAAVFSLLLSAFATTVFGAEIWGDIYGPDLSPVLVVIKVNTTPETQIIANGTYSIQVPDGVYEIIASSPDGEYEFRDTIHAYGNGSSRFDILLVPSLDIEDVPEFGADVDESGIALPVAVAAVFVAASALYFLLHRRRIELDEHARSALSIIQREGRVLQKELRRELGLSESKVSMIVAELESIGLVKKIKKGRANIIVLAKGRKAKPP